MKHILAPIGLSLLLAACTGVGVDSNNISLGLGLGGTIGRHVGLGTSLNIPLTIGRNGNTTTTNNSGINIIEEKILTYFDTQGNTTDSAVKGGYYRQLISKQNNGYLVQDFYSTGEKRTDPMTLSKEQAFSFRAHPNDGTYTVYAINGNIMQQQNFRNGQLVQ